MIRIIAAFLCAVLVCGCATVDFSAVRYTPPPCYKQESLDFLAALQKQLALDHRYTFVIVDDKACSHAGIPEISGYTVKIPELVLKYLYQNYYRHRYHVLASVACHEIAHYEFNSGEKQHFLVDIQAIGLFQRGTLLVPADFYKSLLVLRNYWAARKGVGGQAANIGWNAVQVAALATIGVGVFSDWYATDMNKRVQQIVRKYAIKDRHPYERSAADPACGCGRDYSQVLLLPQYGKEVP